MNLEWEEGEDRWGLLSDGVEVGVVFYCDEPSPETGYEGWIWGAWRPDGSALVEGDARLRSEAQIACERAARRLLREDGR